MDTLKNRKYLHAAGFVLFLFFTTILSAQSPVAPVASGPDIEIRKLPGGEYVVTHAFPWPGNSMLVPVGEKHLVMVDTPYTPEAAEWVLDWIEETLGEREIVEINTGFHFDNLGGNGPLIARGIPVIGSDRTVDMIAERGEESRRLFLGWLGAPKDRRFRERYLTLEYVPPTDIFPMEEGRTVVVGGEEIRIIFPGETHSPDNVVVYFPERELLFGGCMILAGDRVGNTADANMDTWAGAVASLETLPCRTVVPGHGLCFDPGLIRHTVELVK